MTEKSFWSTWIKPVLDDERLPGIANKVQDAFNSGLPDVDYCIDGYAGKLELKYEKQWPVRETTGVPIAVSVNQRRQLRRWVEAGGDAYVLLGVADAWFLLPWDVPEKLTHTQLETIALCQGVGKDSLWILVAYLAPTCAPIDSE